MAIDLDFAAHRSVIAAQREAANPEPVVPGRGALKPAA
jgi:hypothetical protein